MFFERCDWCGRNRIRIYGRSVREKNRHPVVEERRSWEDISIRHELFNLPLSLFYRVFTLVWYPFPPTEEHCHCGSGAKAKSVSLLHVLLCPFLLSSSISVWLSVSLSSFLKCCFFKVSPNNSALELYFASLFMFTWTIWVPWFQVLFSGKWRFLIILYFFLWLSMRTVVRTTIMVVPG